MPVYKLITLPSHQGYWRSSQNNQWSIGCNSLLLKVAIKIWLNELQTKSIFSKSIHCNHRVTGTAVHVQGK